jgi:molybdopterin/thiamine biosynthesis adenylyltransferase
VRLFDSNNNNFPEHLLSPRNTIAHFDVAAIPATHAAEPELFARHEGIPGHDQSVLRDARVVLAGAGGLNSWVALALMRTGCGSIVICDDDLIDRTNLSRQLFFASDVGECKGERLANNLVSHAIGGASITGIPLKFEDALEEYALPADLLVVGVDNNACRLRCVHEAHRRGIPAVFTMLSRDGMRCQSFLQGSAHTDACLWCALPNLDPETSSPCAAAIISSCFLAGSFTLTFIYRALMGWPEGVSPFNWREADLLDVAPVVTGTVTRQPHCRVCG